ncbi:MAG TPA: TraR/DksA C4-type zinc finger protein [Gaiellaceae bacterium]|nr:TraR/DksA C4-type zinc finger protein [Gaiellaceae bacterium]
MSTAIDTEHFKQRLLDERQRAQEALARIQQEDAGLVQGEHEEIQSDNSLGDPASALYDRELDETFEESVERVIDAIDAALERIENGTYGICENGGEQIPPERLEAIPWTTLCIDCKRKAERR